MSAAAQRRLQEEARRVMIATTKQAQAFDAAHEAWLAACALPAISFSNETSKEKRSVSKAFSHLNPQRERCFGLLGEELKKLQRLRDQLAILPTGIVQAAADQVHEAVCSVVLG